MAEQLAFNLPVRSSLERGDFFLSQANAMALSRLDTPATWPLGKLVLVGPQGAGKTHLAHVWAEAEGAEVVKAAALGTLDLGAVDCGMAVDDADQVVKDQETLLFHLHNHLSAMGLPLLLTASSSPSRWSTSLPDLRSRMEGTDVVRIDAPDDALLSAVLLKQFADRQLDVSPAVIGWLVARMDRSFAEARRLVDVLDRAALSEKRPITQHLARRILDKD